MATAAQDAATNTAAALQTLDDVNQYIERPRFRLTDVVNMLGRHGKAETLQAELQWLVAQGYMTLQFGIYETTRAGRSYAAARDTSDDAPLIEFVSSAPPPKEPERRDPRDRRR